MRYAVHYHKDFRHFDDVDEVVFDYQGTENIVTFIPKLLREDQRAVINLKKYEISYVIPYLNKLAEIHSKFIVQINSYIHIDDIQLLKDNNIDFMFNDYCRDYDTFYTMIKYGAKDIYIVEDLAFDLKSLHTVLNKHGINLRVFPDIAQCARGTRGHVPTITKFWIRPEDTELYEDYVDVFELCRLDSRLSVAYEVYKQRQWKGQIQDLILDIDIDIDNSTIAPNFGKERIGCQKKCMLGRCNLCYEIEKLANSFSAADIELIKDKYKPYVSSQETDKILKELKERGKEIIKSESETNKKVMQPPAE